MERLLRIDVERWRVNTDFLCLECELSSSGLSLLNVTDFLRLIDYPLGLFPSS